MRAPTLEEFDRLPDDMLAVPCVALTDAESLWLLHGYERPLQPTGVITSSGQIVSAERVVAALNALIENKRRS